MKNKRSVQVVVAGAALAFLAWLLVGCNAFDPYGGYPDQGYGGYPDQGYGASAYDPYGQPQQPQQPQQGYRSGTPAPPGAPPPQNYGGYGQQAPTASFVAGQQGGTPQLCPRCQAITQQQPQQGYGQAPRRPW